MSWIRSAAPGCASPCRCRPGAAGRLRTPAAALCLALLGGCETLDRLVTEIPPADQIRQRALVSELIGYAKRVRDASPAELEALRADARAAISASPTPEDRIRLAILLGLAPEPVRDESRARALLGEVAETTSGAGAEVLAFAALLDGTLAERLALRRGCDAEIATERRRRKAAEQQLEELKAIEEQLNLR